MPDIANIKRAHCVGIGGIHVSAVARLLKSRGVTVSGSDAVAGDETSLLEKQGFAVTIRHAATNVPADADVVIYSHAVPEDNAELAEAKKRGIPVYHTHAFLGELFKDAKQIVVTGTHGKSTTTAMIGTILIAGGENPTVVVGTKVPGFSDGNLRIGRDDLLVVEGDEYQRHVLSYVPTVLVLNNMELDHTDIFPTMDEYAAMFGEAIGRVKDGGAVIWNAEDRGLAELVAARKAACGKRNVGLVAVRRTDVPLRVPGEMNQRNAAMASAAVQAWKPDIDPSIAAKALADFPGVWRRFERVGEFNGATVISDYGHHPTEVRETLKAAKLAFPAKRVVLCFQPHQRNRTKHLFNDFVEVLKDADVLVLVEIYDVPGREEEEDRDVTSEKLLQAIGKGSYAATLDDAEAQLRKIVTPNDVVLVMGAGTIDQVARKLVKT
ncbi:UDP-N-acetylmuramate--L-alanine ligase [Candidatus Uhrbacteria bacterium RIFCSPHIGHO2_02_FULL_60_44]|nr:MAG: UDP-N-acetylmuramate--L-alanine ligase [Candidatus Uhrbacteria bacterium RIFCSPHIGHO2_02_FULL_60_44]